MANHDHLSNIGLHPAYDPDPLVSIPVRIEALERRVADAQHEIENLRRDLVTAVFNSKRV